MKGWPSTGFKWLVGVQLSSGLKELWFGGLAELWLQMVGGGAAKLWAQARSNLWGRYGHGRTTLILWGTRTSEYAKVGVAIMSTQYGHTTCYISGAGGGSGFEGLAG